MSIRNLVLLALIACSITTLPSFAGDWYDKYDKNHDGRWDYKEFRRAHNEYWKRHQDESPLRDEELRAEFGRRAYNPNGFVHRSGVKDFHNW
jgi:hypothetical protein